MLYRRPDKLEAAQAFEWTESDEATILEMNDADLGEAQFYSIFHQLAPFADVSIGGYYLPLALQYMERHADHSLTFLRGVVRFIASRRRELQKANAYDDLLLRLSNVLCVWTSTFDILPTTAGEVNATNVCAALPLLRLLQACSEYADLRRLVKSFAKSLNNEGTLVGTLWFLTIAREINNSFVDLANKSAVYDFTKRANLSKQLTILSREHENSPLLALYITALKLSFSPP